MTMKLRIVFLQYFPIPYQQQVDNVHIFSRLRNIVSDKGL